MQSTVEDGAGGMGMSMQMQVCEDGGGMMAQSMGSASAASASADSDTLYRRIERTYKSTSNGSKRKGAALSRRERRAQHAATAKGDENAHSGEFDSDWDRWRPHTLDLSGDLSRNSPDLRSQLREHTRTDLASGVVPDWVSPSTRIYSFASAPGFLFLSGALDPAAQVWWSWRCLAGYSREIHTNLTNLEKVKEKERQENERKAKQQHETNETKMDASVAPSSSSSSSSAAVTSSSTPPSPPAPSPDIWSAACASGDFSTLSRLRWSSLGYMYDWTHREYTSDARAPFPTELADLTLELARAANVEFQTPEAAIVNYYPAGGMMGAHVDDAELTKLQPIVSVSLGCAAIFLLGGRSKHDQPTGFIVRSGDAVIMGGESRVCYHGVPRIIDNSFPNVRGEGENRADKKPRHEQTNTEHNDEATPSNTPAAAASASPDDDDDKEWTPEQSLNSLPMHPSDANSDLGRPIFPSCIGSLVPTRSDLLHTYRFMRHSRLNLNVRQVEDEQFRYDQGMTSASMRQMSLEQQRQKRTNRQENEETKTTTSDQTNTSSERKSP